MPPLKIGSLFSGYGGLDRAVESVLDAETAWFVEFDEAPSRVLDRRWPGVPNYGDVTKVDWREVPPVDIITGGSPCQDLSNAGRRAGMTEGTRSNLWVNMREAIDTIRPRLVVWENVQGALSASAKSASDMESGDGSVGDGGGGHLRALGRVLGDLAESGYDATWTTLRASDVGAPHHRARVFLLARPQVSPDASGGGSEAVNDGPGRAEARGVGDRRPDGGAGSLPPDADVDGLETRHVLPVGSREEVPGDHGRLGLLPDADVWGRYAPAVERWGRLTRPAPVPTETSGSGKPRLNAKFAEWMMGLPDGWVTDPSLWEGVSPASARRAQLKMIGNGVCPQQAEQAIRILLDLLVRYD